MMKTKRITALTMALCMLLALIPVLALQVVFPVRAGAYDPMTIHIGGDVYPLDEGEQGTLGSNWYWDGEDTLILYGNYSGEGVWLFSDDIEKVNIIYHDGATVDFELGSISDLDISGTGTLTHEGEFGISSWGDLTFSGGTVTITAYGDHAIKAENVSISNSTVTINIDSDGYSGIKAEENVTIGANSVVTINSYREGIEAQNVAVNAGLLTINSNAYGIMAWNSVSVNGGTLNITTDTWLNVELPDEIMLSDGIFTEGSFSIKGGSVTIDATNNGIYAFGDVTIDSGTINITAAGEAGIFAWESIYFKGGSGTINGGDYAAIAASWDTLSVADSVTVWIPGTTTLTDVKIDGEYENDWSGPVSAQYFVEAPNGTEPLAAIRFGTFTVTVNNGKRLALVTGAEITSPSSAIAKDVIHLVANAAPEGQKFKDWTFSGTVEFVKGTSTNPDIEITMPFASVTATANYEALLPNENTITVTHTGNGVANPNTNAAVQGATVTITATPDSGNSFVRWEVISGGVTLSSTTTATATFTMPNEAVVIRAVFNEDIAQTGIDNNIIISVMAIIFGAAFIGTAEKLRRRVKN